MGRVALVGAGPGRADLLTLRAAQLLAQAGAVLHDRLVSNEVLALVPPGVEMHYVGKEEGQQEAVQERTMLLLGECANRHPLVVRLKGGDPMVFGRGAEEWSWLAARGHEVEYVPGISSAVSVPGLAGIPLTFRHLAGGFAIITGHRAASCQTWAAYAKADTLIVLMGVQHRGEIASCLISHGRPADQPVAFIENGSTRRERVVVGTLRQVAEGALQVEAPAVMVAGAVVTLRDELISAVHELCAAF
jgi:uroporphyrin-III C-methyltransferase